MIHKISTKGMSRDEWLQLRQKTIGGSDAATIIGLNKWETPYSVWAEKTGRIAHTAVSYTHLPHQRKHGILQ